MGDDAKADSKSSESDSSTWDFGGEETQIVDTQCFDSPTSSPGNKCNGDYTEQMHILQSTIPFDDTAVLEDDFATQLMDPDGETQVVNFYDDTQVVNLETEIEEMDILDSLERNATQLFNDSDTEELVGTDLEDTEKIEVVDDSDEDSSRRECKHTQHTSGGNFRNFTSIRAASMRASGLAARNKASQRNKLNDQPETGSRCGFGRSTARKLFAEETLPETKEGNDNIDLCGKANLPLETDLAGLNYLDSQEPGEASQQNALDFVDNFLKVNIECSDKPDTNKSSERKSKPVLSAKGIQTLAKSSNLINAVGEIEIFEWDNTREDEAGGEFIKRKREALFAYGGRKLKSSSFSKGGRKLEESKGKKQMHSRAIVSGLASSDSKLVLTNRKLTGVQETTDVRFDTQMAAEAMEDLSFGLHTTGDDSTKEGENGNNMQKGSHKSHKAPPLTNGVRTRQSKLKRSDENERETHDTVTLKEPKRAKSAAKKNVSSDIGKRGKLTLKRKEVDTEEGQLTSVDQIPVKKHCIQTVIPVARRTRQSMRDYKSEKVKDASNNLTEEINIFHPKGKRTSRKLSSVSRSTRSKAAILNEEGKESPGVEGSERETIEPIATTCTTPVNHATPLKESSPICMGDEYLKQSWKKSSLRSSIIQEPDSLTPTRVEFTSPMKDLRKRRDLSMIHVLFSRHLDADIVKQQKKILSRIHASEACSMSEATHFIADEFTRTRNMLEAIALGKPVVTHLWLESCRQSHSHIHEKNFILRDFKKETELGFNLPSSLTRARKHPLFKGHRVLITPNTKPGKEILASLVKAVGGVVVERLGRTAVKDDKVPEGLILSCEEDYALCLPFLEKGAAVYSSELLLNGIVTQRLEYERHRLFLDQVKRTRSKNWLNKPVSKVK
ncbi:unnamed protein product [Lactuca virosa]|uniref:BRCT domain-containing protein n=1 Tax=Lactuca virosa TaxID=75947 RepID=A0AAU9MEF3_9ASTR|nr:unnamed protein product [Lactuca virosa]